jgi:enoyl-CoA hydratase/carnithine racemase
MELEATYAGGKLTCEVRDGVCHLGLNDAEHMNAFTVAMCFGLHQAVRAAVDTGQRRFVLYGHGDNFSSGANLVEYQRSVAAITQGDGFEEFYESERALLDLARILRQPDVLSVAACHGWVIGQAFEVITACDFVVAAPGTTFRLPEIGMGLIPGAGGTVSIPSRIGRWRTLYLALTGTALDAETALAWGLVDRLAVGGVDRSDIP